MAAWTSHEEKAGQGMKDWSRCSGKLYGLQRWAILKIHLANLKCDTDTVLHRYFSWSHEQEQ